MSVLFSHLKISDGSLGKLSFKEESAGKLRVFAMVDSFTQWIFQPIHDKIFFILNRIKSDGTFNQTAPLSRLVDSKRKFSLYSFDLSSATDRLSIILQQKLLAPLIGESLSHSWVNILIGRSYEYKYGSFSGSVKYAVGQPMGALSS